MDASRSLRSYPIITMNEKLPQKKVAILPGNRLGDGLLMSVLSHNLSLNGYSVTTFSTILGSLASWFPSLHFNVLPSLDEAKTVLQDYDLIIHQHPNPLSRIYTKPHQETVVLYGTPFFMQRKSLIDVYMDVCKQTLKLADLSRTNGLKIPYPDLQFRKFMNRVVIHPTSLRKEKNWPVQKFLKLADRLISLGYEPNFTVSPQEFPQWQWLQNHYILKIFPTLDGLAQFLYESGFMIGNDSGVAHLASNLGIPTVTLFIRPGVARRWKPNFYPGKVLLPAIHLPGKQLKEIFWKHLISVNQVVDAFEQLTQLKGY